MAAEAKNVGEEEGCSLFTERSAVLLFWDAVHHAKRFELVLRCGSREELPG